ncbi:quinone oxidoreductase family protein [Streptomyces inhibens]|uniref:quinone oxidoreductase family protein n=1 Tax=Streptomyces inhibens TaxID=2293571 RepID=UPI0037B78B30
MHAIRIEEHGGPEVMRWTELPDPSPGPGEALVRLGAAGVNYMDVGARAEGGPGWAAPVILGAEGTGYVTAVGEGVRDLAVGDRVAWFYHPGSYAELLAVPADSLVKVPDGISDETAAAVMMQGLTASHLSTETYPIGPGDTAVVHAAAGGVGQLLTQMIRARGGRVIGLVSREEKVPIAKEAGADHVLVHSGGGFEEQVRELTGGPGADVVYDGGGTGTFRSSQLALRPHGVHAYYGPHPQTCRPRSRPPLPPGLNGLRRRGTPGHLVTGRPPASGRSCRALTDTCPHASVSYADPPYTEQARPHSRTGQRGRCEM